MFDRVLMVCVGNICRSPMAQVVFHSRLAPHFPKLIVESAGLSALEGRPADPIAIDLMDERGIDLRAHRGRQLNPTLLKTFDLILVMESYQQRAIEASSPIVRGKVHRIGKWSDFDVPDPFGKGRHAFERALSMIDQGVADFASKFWPEGNT